MTLPSTTAPSWRPPTPSTMVEVNTLPTTVNLNFTTHPAVTANASLIVNDDDGDPLIVEMVPASIPAGWVVTCRVSRCRSQRPLGRRSTPRMYSGSTQWTTRVVKVQ